MLHFERGKVWSTAACRPWAGIWWMIWLILEEEPGFVIRKTKAHKSIEAARAENKEYEWHGNRKADILAKKGAALHPHCSNLLASIADYDERISDFAAHVGKVHSVLQRFPDVTPRQQRLKRDRQVPASRCSGLDVIPPEEGGHLWWQLSSSKWRCEICNCTARSPSLCKRALCKSPFAASVSKRRPLSHL